MGGSSKLRGWIASLIAVSVIAVMSACSDGTGATQTGGSSAALSSTGDPIPEITRTEEAGPEGLTLKGRQVTVDLPVGTVPSGQRFRVGVGQPIGQPTGARALNETYGAPVQVEHQVPLTRAAHISWDVSGLSEEQRASLVLVRWDPELQVWRVAAEKSNLTDSQLTADVAQFSIITWISSGAATISQTVGQITGKRADAPKCADGSLPTWVRNVVRPDADQPAVPIRTCTESDKDNRLTVRVANNRPYTQALDLTQGEKYAWTWEGERDLTPAGIVGDTLSGLMSGDKTLVMAPTRATAVGFARPSTPGQAQLTMVAHPTVATVSADMLIALLDNGLGMDTVSGFDSASLNAFVQTVYDCGGKQVLKSRDLAGADTPQKVLETLKSCGESDAVRTGIENVLRDQVAKGGQTAAHAIRTNRILHQLLGKLGIYLKVADFSSYTAELTSSGAIGDVAISVFAAGTPQALGEWQATCSSAGTDSDRLYRNLALQDAFQDSSKELWQFQTWQPSALTAVKPLGKCSDSYLEQIAQNVESAWADKKAAAIVATAIRDLQDQSPSADGGRFVDYRYGFSCVMPGGWSVQLAGNGDGATATDPTGSATMTCSGSNNVFDDSARQAQERARAGLIANGVNVTYELLTDSSYVLSGIGADGRIVYEWRVVGEGSENAVYWTYPVSMESALDAALNASVNTFDQGDLTQPH